MDIEREQYLDTFLSVASQLDPDDENGLKAALQRRFDSPPVQIIAESLGLVSISKAEVQQLLFAPSSYHMGLYPQLLRGDETQPGDLSIPANRLQGVVLGHMFLVHSKCWDRVKPFIAAGGLRQLVALLSNPHPVLASQALQVLIFATHPSTYDWNPEHTEQAANSQRGVQHSSQQDDSRKSDSSATSSVDAPRACSHSRIEATKSSHPAGSNPATAAVHPAAGPDCEAWRELLQLQSGPLLTSLLRMSPDIFPESGFMAVQFLVFYLKWLRRWWTKDGVLQLSAGLLAGLSAWAGRTSAKPEERQLAALLLEDFGSRGPAPAVPGAGAGDVSVNCSFESELRVVTDRTLVNSRPGSEAERLKAAGNDAFKAKDWSTAIQLYSAALDVPVPHVALLDEAPRRATYHANRAAAYLERCRELQQSHAAAGGDGDSSSSSTQPGSACWHEVGGVLDGLVLDESSPEARVQLLQAAVTDCKAALDLVPTYGKAHYRLATALRAQGSLKAAQAAAKAAGQHAKCSAEQTAAAQLEASIAKQLSQQGPKQPTPRHGSKPQPPEQRPMPQPLQQPLETDVQDKGNSVQQLITDITAQPAQSKIAAKGPSTSTQGAQPCSTQVSKQGLKLQPPQQPLKARVQDSNSTVKQLITEITEQPAESEMSIRGSSTSTKAEQPSSHQQQHQQKPLITSAAAGKQLISNMSEQPAQSQIAARGPSTSINGERPGGAQQPQQPQKPLIKPPTGRRTQASKSAAAVDQLLQQFAAVMQQQVTGKEQPKQSGGKAAQAAGAAAPAASKQPGVLLPFAAKLHELEDQQTSTDQLAMPGAHNSSKPGTGKRAQPYKPLIQEVVDFGKLGLEEEEELADCEKIPAGDLKVQEHAVLSKKTEQLIAVATRSCGSSGMSQQQQKHSGPSLEELLEIMD